MVDSKYRYQVQVDGTRAATDRFATPQSAQGVANRIISAGKINKHKYVKIIDLANSRVLGESRDGSPIRKLRP